VKDNNITFRQVINILLIVLLLIFVAQNLEQIKVSFLFFGFSMPLVILIAVVFLIGYLSGVWTRKPPKKN